MLASEGGYKVIVSPPCEGPLGVESFDLDEHVVPAYSEREEVLLDRSQVDPALDTEESREGEDVVALKHCRWRSWPRTAAKVVLVSHDTATMDREQGRTAGYEPSLDVLCWRVTGGPVHPIVSDWYHQKVLLLVALESASVASLRKNSYLVSASV